MCCCSVWSSIFVFVVVVQSSGESFILENALVYSDLLTSIQDLDDWMAPQPVEKDIPTLLQMSTPYTVAEPYGIVALFGAWNYPVQLILLPLIGAIAGGNAVLIKPSEISVATSNLMAKYLPKYLDAVSLLEHT